MKTRAAAVVGVVAKVCAAAAAVANSGGNNCSGLCLCLKTYWVAFLCATPFGVTAFVAAVADSMTAAAGVCAWV